MFAINRQTTTNQGTGLPFYTQTRYQCRFDEVGSSETTGYYECPQNHLPTFQVWLPTLVTKVEIVPTTGKVDGTAFEIPLGNLITVCEGNTPANIYYTLDDERNFTLECGTYYIRLTLDDASERYSDIFRVDGVCCYGIDMVHTDTVLMDDSIDIDFEIIHASTANVTQYDSLFGVNSFNTQTFSDNIASGVTKNLTIEIDTAYCGLFSQTWEFRNLGGGVLVVTKLYP